MYKGKSKLTQLQCKSKFELVSQKYHKTFLEIGKKMGCVCFGGFLVENNATLSTG